MGRIIWTGLSAFLLGATLCGCASGIGPSGAERFGAESDPPEAMTVDEAYPEFETLRDGKAPPDPLYEIVGGGPPEVRIVFGSTENGDAPLMTMERRRGDDRLERRQVRVSESDGLVMSEITNDDRDVITRFDPPLTMFPGKLRRGETYTQKVAMTVHPADTPERIQNRGTGTVEIALDMKQAVQTAGGAVETVRVKTVFTTDLGVAKVVRTTYAWFEPGVGLIAERFEENIRALLVPLESSGQTIIRQE